MAKIGSLPEWYAKTVPEKVYDFQQEKDQIINTYTQVVNGLRGEIEDLKKRLDLKDQEINFMTVDFEPAKRNLLLKLSLLCEKLKLNSNIDYEAWIEEVEVSRIRARFNEETIQTLEKSLKEHKEKIMQLERQLRCFGVELKNGEFATFDINQYLRWTFTICEDLNARLCLSENTVGIIEECMGADTKYGKELWKKRLQSGKNRKFCAMDFQDTLNCIGKNFEEIREKVKMLEDHERVKQDLVMKFHNFQGKEIEKKCNENLNESLKFSSFLIAAKKENLSFSSQLAQITSQKFVNEREKSLIGKVIGGLDIQGSLNTLQKKMVLFTPTEEKCFVGQELIGTLIDLLSISEHTFEELLQGNMTFAADFNRLVDERKMILAGKNEDLYQFVKQLSGLMTRHEQLKIKIISEIGKIGKEGVLLLVEKLETELPMVKSLPFDLPIEIQTPNPSMSLIQLISIDKSLLKIYETYMNSIKNSRAMDFKLQKHIKQLSRLSETTEQFQLLLKPRDGPLAAEVQELQSQLESAKNTTNPLEIAETLSVSMEIINSILRTCLSEIPEVFPALQELEKLSVLMRSSNFTVEFLAKSFGKSENYRAMIDIEGIPKLEMQVEREFSMRWKWISEFIDRVSVVGLGLEQVKRSIIENIENDDKIIQRPEKSNNFELEEKLKKTIEDEHRMKKMHEAEIARLVKNYQEEILELGKKLAKETGEKNLLEKNKEALAKQNEAFSEERKFHLDTLSELFNKISGILVKTDFVGDTLMDVLPDPGLKAKMDKFQVQFEEIIGKSEVSPDSIHELLDLLDRYESANGVQSSRMAGISNKIAEEDLVSLSTTAKTKPSMKAKKNLRSGRPAVVAPINGLKQTLEFLNENLAEIDKNENSVNKPQEDEDEYWEEICKKTMKSMSTVKSFYEKLISTEIEREESISEQIRVCMDQQNEIYMGELNVLVKSLERVKVSQVDSISELVSKARSKLELEKHLAKIRTGLGFKENFKSLGKDLEKICHESIKESLSTLRLLSAPNEETLKIRENINKLTFSGPPPQIISEVSDLLKALISLENFKKNILGSEDLSNALSEILQKFQDFSKKNSSNIENLWVLFLKMIGKDSDRLLTKGLIFTLPQAGSGLISEVVEVMKGSLVMIDEFAEKNEKKIREITVRVDEILDTAGDVEEGLDEIIRRYIKDLAGNDEAALKKQISAINEEFEDVSNDICKTFIEKLAHLNRDLAMFTKLENIKRRLMDAQQKVLKKLENELIQKTSEIETLTAAAENEKKTLINKLTLTESSLKETKALFDKTSSEKYEKELEVVTLKNSSKDLSNKIEELQNEISQLSDEISDQKSSLRANRNSIKEKNDEISVLKDQIEEQKNILSKPVIDEEAVSSLRAEIHKLSEAFNIKQKELDGKHDDWMICKRDKELLRIEVQSQNKLINGLREELGTLKAKILLVESNLKEVEEKNKLGVDRDDISIKLLFEKLEMNENENKNLKNQLGPAMNYRTLYSEIRGELELLRQGNDENLNFISELTKKLKTLIRENEKLQYENRMMEKYKKEWVSAKDTCEILSKKLSFFNQSIEKSGGDIQSVLKSLTEDLQESMSSQNLLRENSEEFEKKAKENQENIEKIRKKNAFFKILMIGRIKSYYRFSTWKNVTETPSNAAKEDPNLVQYYMKYVVAKVPSIGEIENSKDIEESIQKALNNSSIRLHYQKFALKSSPMPRMSLISLLSDFFIEKAEFDLKTMTLNNYVSVPSHFLNRLRDMYGTPSQVNAAFSEIVPSLFSLYQEECQFAIFSCKLLQVFDPTPATNFEAPALLQLYSKLFQAWLRSNLFTEYSTTAGIFTLSEILDIIKEVLGSDQKVYKVFTKNLVFPDLDPQQLSLLKTMKELYRLNYQMNHKTLSSELQICELISQDLLESLESSLGNEFYYNYPRQVIEEQCEKIKVTGTAFLCSSLNALISVKSSQMSECKKYFANKDFLSQLQFTEALQQLNIPDETIEKLYFSADSQSESPSGISKKVFFNTLSQKKILDFYIPLSTSQSPNSPSKEESKSDSVSRQTSLISDTTEVRIGKKIIKKKLMKKNS